MVCCAIIRNIFALRDSFFIGLAAQWWSGRRRIFVLILIIGALTGHRSMTPDLYILGRGGDIAFYNREGLLSMVQKPRNMFVTQQWFDAAGQDVSVLARGCRKGLCLIYLKGSAKVAIAYTRDAVRQACDAVDLVISHCDHSIDWIHHWIGDTSIIHNITIFSKCNNTVEGAPKNANIIRLEK